MPDWFSHLPISAMALVIFAGVYLAATAVHIIISRLAADERRARAFKALSPGMLPPLGIIFGLLVGFIAVQVWSDFDRAKAAVANEASALRAVHLLAANLPPETEAAIRAHLIRHIDTSAGTEWTAMAGKRATLELPPAELIEVLQRALSVEPPNEGTRTAQREVVTALQSALEARRYRIILSQSAVSPVKWTGLLLQALVTLIAIALVHSGDRLTSAIALALFSTGVAISALLIAAYDRPFTGDISVGPHLLQQVIPRSAGGTP